MLVVVWLALIVYTYLDARRRVSDPFLVACATVGAFIPYIGTAVYAILRPPEFLEDAHERELEIRAAELRVRQLDRGSCQVRVPGREELPALPQVPAPAQGPLPELRQAGRPALGALPLLRSRPLAGAARRTTAETRAERTPGAPDARRPRRARKPPAERQPTAKRAEPRAPRARRRRPQPKPTTPKEPST